MCLLREIKDFNKDKSKKEKVSTRHFNILGPTKPIYVSETLTQKTQKLLHLTREYGKEYGYTYCWISRGIIYLYNTERHPQVRVNIESDLSKFIALCD